MLIGEHHHTLDTKKRMSLPAHFRKVLGKSVVVTRGLDGCLFVYSAKEWKEFSEKLITLPVGSARIRAFNRFMLTGAYETQVDTAGRILIPDPLKEFAGLSTKVIVAGMVNRVELWNETAWKSYQKQLVTRADDLAEHLGEIGMI